MPDTYEENVIVIAAEEYDVSDRSEMDDIMTSGRIRTIQPMKITVRVMEG